MWKSRLGWAVWLAAAFLFYVFSEDYLVLWFLICSLLAPVFGFCLTFPARRMLGGSITVLPQAEKQQTIQGCIRISNPSCFPGGRFCGWLHYVNLLTGEEKKEYLDFNVGIHETREVSFQYSSAYCGRIRVTVEQMRICDYWKIFARSYTFSAHGQTSVLPDLFPMETLVTGGGAANMESVEYADACAGYDQSEIYQMRDYMPGDSVRSIHWKLSQKYDRLIIREGSLPIENSILILLETGSVRSPRVQDTLAEIVLSMAQSLAQQGITFDLGWQDQRTGEFRRYVIADTDHILEMLPGLLGAGAAASSLSGIECFEKNYGPCEFAHVVYLGSDQEHVSEHLPLAGMQTMILCGEETARDMEDETVRTVCCTPDTVEEKLYYLAI